MRLLPLLVPLMLAGINEVHARLAGPGSSEGANATPESVANTLRSTSSEVKEAADYTHGKVLTWEARLRGPELQHLLKEGAKVVKFEAAANDFITSAKEADNKLKAVLSTS
mmetsp:Transcript_85927/g.161817  ORF Transcript_85927/g.161817 Transcript_85927/m.161817 type:complete len:111 (+) Transcript_85927:71-403(+)